MNGSDCFAHVSDSEDEDVNAHAAEQFVLQMQERAFPISHRSPMLHGMVRESLDKRALSTHNEVEVLAQVHVTRATVCRTGITPWKFMCYLTFEHNKIRYTCDSALTPGAFFEACAWHRAAIAFVHTRSVTGFAVSRRRNGKLWAMCADQVADMFSWSPEVMTPNLPQCVRCSVQHASDATCSIMFMHGRTWHSLKHAENMNVWDVYALCSTYTNLPQNIACLYPALASATSYAFGVPKCYAKGLARLREAPIGATWLGFVSLGQRAVVAANGTRLVFADSGDAYSRERTSVYGGGLDFVQWAAMVQKAGTWRVYSPQPVYAISDKSEISPEAVKFASRRGVKKRSFTPCLRCKNCKRKKKCLFPAQSSAAVKCHGPMCSATDNISACRANAQVLHCSRCAKSCYECMAIDSTHDRVKCAFHSPCTMQLERGKTWCKVLASQVHKRVVVLQDFSTVQFDAAHALVCFDNPVLYAQFAGQCAEKVPLDSNLHEWLRQPCPGCDTTTRGEILRRGNVHLATLEQQLPYCNSKHYSKAPWRTVTDVTLPPASANCLHMDALHVALKHCANSSPEKIVHALLTSSCMVVPKIDTPCAPFALPLGTFPLLVAPLVQMLDVLQYRSRRLLEIGENNFSANLCSRVAYVCHAYPGDNKPYDIILWPSYNRTAKNGALLTQLVCSNWSCVQNAVLITALRIDESVLQHIDAKLQHHFVPLFNLSNWQCTLLVGQ